ncbi:hypothetical protein TNIN_463161 [Trichonephila inaurata madagascariensis]|uniref:Uncharacterized protein n=1 Tax=Trichonephila inaurata madagascariensis TaxID=2747483 RepID=A0A8X6WR32_9ARAC|nr:hypothetical protein TNIN_463161 [Trichonephila inaurata madagascariensis]
MNRISKHTSFDYHYLLQLLLFISFVALRNHKSSTICWSPTELSLFVVTQNQVYKDFGLMLHTVYLHYHTKEHLTGLFSLEVL